MNGEVVSPYAWRPIGAVKHAFSRFSNPPDRPWLVAMCGQSASTHDVLVSEVNTRFSHGTTAPCFACRVLMDDQLG